MRKKSIPLAAEKIATEKALRKSIQTEGDTPMEDLYFFDPTRLYKAFMSSDIAANIHSGMAEYHDFRMIDGSRMFTLVSITSE